MSFAISISRPVLFASSVGGVSLGIALLLLPWKNISFENSSSHPSLLSRRMSPLKRKKPQENNCKVVNTQQGIVDRLLKEKEQIYISFSCQNPKVSEEMLTNWHGFFPQDLFNGGSKSFPVNKQFSIEIKEEDNEDPEHQGNGLYKTTFISKSFSNSEPIVGRWSDDIVEGTEDNPVYKVKLDNSPSSIEYVYLTHS